jgi:adenylate cyclase, class 2
MKTEKKLNVEIKARVSDSKEIDKILEGLTIDSKRTEIQEDTYFKIQTGGRLKLRQIKSTLGAYSELIQYDRFDDPNPKISAVTLIQIEPGSELENILLDSFEVSVKVHKTRRIYFAGNVKIHKDVVYGLGEFVEIGAIDSDGTIGEKKLREQCENYMGVLKIKKEDLISCSYSDMLLEKQR